MADYANNPARSRCSPETQQSGQSIVTHLSRKSATRSSASLIGRGKDWSARSYLRSIPLSRHVGKKGYDLPSFYLANARSLEKKFDELTAQLLSTCMDIAVITESWFNDDIVLTILGYVLQRRERPTCEGGVCTFVSSSIPFKRRSDLESPDHECMWLWLRPPRLPRPFSGIIVGAMYFPHAPADEQRVRASYIIECIDSVKSAHPDCGMVLLGDFNTLDVKNILTNHTLKQLVREPTRGNSVLDLVISNLASYYNKPVVSAHLGSSDHCSVHWVPNSNYGSSKLTAKKKVVKTRRFPESALNAFGRWVSAHSWFAHTCAVDYLLVDDLTTSFSDDLCKAINIYFPAKSVKIHPTDKPWMSAEIKLLILERQRAFHSGSNEKWRLLRNKVRMAICKRKKEFFACMVKSLKTSDPRSWWSLVSKLAGKS